MGICVRAPFHKRLSSLLPTVCRIVTALLPVLGYKNASKVAKYAQEHEVSVSEAALALDMMTEEQLHEWLDPKAMTSNKSSSMRFDIEGTMSNDE